MCDRSHGVAVGFESGARAGKLRPTRWLACACSRWVRCESGTCRHLPQAQLPCCTTLLLDRNSSCKMCRTHDRRGLCGGLAGLALRIDTSSCTFLHVDAARICEPVWAKFAPCISSICVSWTLDKYSRMRTNLKTAQLCATVKKIIQEGSADGTGHGTTHGTTQQDDMSARARHMHAVVVVLIGQKWGHRWHLTVTQP